MPFIFSSDPNEFCATFLFTPPEFYINALTETVFTSSSLAFFGSSTPPITTITFSSNYPFLTVNTGKSNMAPSWCLNDGQRSDFILNSLPLGTISHQWDYIVGRETLFDISSFLTMTVMCPTINSNLQYWASTPPAVEYSGLNFYTN